MARDLFNAVKVVRAIFPQAVGTSGAGNGVTSPIIDRLGYESVLFDIAYGTAGATSDTITPVVFEADATDGSFTSVADADLIGTEAAAALPAQATARTSGVGKNVSKKVGYKGIKRYCKLRLYGIGTATGLVAANALLGHPLHAPAATG